MGSFMPFTEEQREQARRTDLAAFLRQCGEKVKKSGTENMWLDHGQKVTIRGNLWSHQYEQVGGDAIDFVCRFYGMDYPEAVQLMLSMGVVTVQGTMEPSTDCQGVCALAGSGRMVRLNSTALSAVRISFPPLFNSR